MPEKKREKTCELCGRKYIASTKAQRFCSHSCASRSRWIITKCREKGRIDEINAKARSLGMSYGQYVAAEYMRSKESGV